MTPTQDATPLSSASSPLHRESSQRDPLQRDNEFGIRLLLVCHAEGMHNRYAHLANENSGLTARGWEQSDVVANWLRTHQTVDALVSDSLLQSRLTAQRIGQALDLPVSVCREIPNCPHDTWKPAVMEPGSLTPLSGWTEGARAQAARQNELYTAYTRALVEALDRLLVEHWGSTLALVTSGEGIAAVIRHLFGGQLPDVRVAHTSITEVSHQENYWRVNYLNKQEHLPTPVVTPREARSEPVSVVEPIEDLTEIVQVYNRVAGGDLERKRQDDRQRIRHLLNFAKIAPDLRILDLGTGIGVLPLMLAEDGARSVVGIDVSPAMLELAEYTRLSKLTPASTRVNYRLAPAQALPFPNESFDVVTCRLVLNHARKPERILREVVRVLRPGGLLVLAELLSVDNSVKRATHNAIEERRNAAHVAARTAEQYVKLVTDAGLTIEAKDSVSFERELEEWLSIYQPDRADAAAVREMIEAGLETDAAGMNARRQGGTLVFEQRMVYLKASKQVARG